MNTREFCRLLAKKINDAGDAVGCKAKYVDGEWQIIDYMHDWQTQIPDAVCQEVLYRNIRWQRRFEEYRVGMVDEFHAIGGKSGNDCYFYVGPSKVIKMTI